jgi:hypothetical protein
MAVSRIIRSRGPLAYPGTSPGFDPAHVAGNACTLSAVFFGGTFVDILTGRQGTISTGSPTAQMHSVLGPCLNMSSSNVAISGKRAYGANAAPLGDTMACIAMLNGTAAQQGLIALGLNGTDTGYSWLGVPSANAVSGVAHAGLAAANGPDVGSGTPFFLAASQNLSAATSATQTAVFVAVNLLTGKMTTASTSQGSYNVGSRNGTYNIGSRGAGSAPATASIRCVMSNDMFMPLPALVQWAKEPWKFWHPK